MVKEDISLVKRNVDRLYRIVNQILDFRKIDNDKMKLILREANIVELAMEVYDYFVGIAEEKQINYEFHSEVKELSIYIDVDKIEQVLVNILSNAFKYSGKNGVVKMTIKDKPDVILIYIEDQGKGLLKEDIDHLFERFYTGHKSFGVQGFGIGLNLSKEYIDLHDGKIQVESQPGEYTQFCIQLYKDINHYTHDYILEENNFIKLNEYKSLESDRDIINELLTKQYPYRILIVEDDPDVRSYLRRELSAHFLVEALDDGKEAIAFLDKDNDFTLIISDVLMPEINGFQLISKIKNDMKFSHIPIILLTALSEESQKIYGIAEGADEYIQKPFNIDFLKIRIINIVQERHRMKDSFMQHLQCGFIDNMEINKIVNIDDLFRYKLLEVIEAQYTNSDFSIEDLSEQIGLSRVHLYRKTKALFDLSPTDFLKNYRLNKALLLLKQKQYNVGEIGYMTGFTSPAYFTKCFKSMYGATPSEYLTSLSENNEIKSK